MKFRLRYVPRRHQPVKDLKVELVRLYRFTVDGQVLCGFPAKQSWLDIQNGVMLELQRRFSLPESDARDLWARLRSE